MKYVKYVQYVKYVLGRGTKKFTCATLLLNPNGMLRLCIENIGWGKCLQRFRTTYQDQENQCFWKKSNADQASDEEIAKDELDRPPGGGGEAASKEEQNQLLGVEEGILETDPRSQILDSRS